MSRPCRDDRGVFSVIYALVALSLVMTAAVVVDLSSMRENRRLERLAADAAATAGAAKLSPLAGQASPQAACQEAWRFLKVDLPGASGATPACSLTNFPSTITTCPSPAVTRTQSGPAGSWTVTIAWPIPNDDPAVSGDSPYLEDPDVTGRGTYVQPPDPANDGVEPCGRLAVTVAKTAHFMFAGAGGFSQSTTSNTSVARYDIRGDIKDEFPLVVLDQHGCDVVDAGGSSPQAAVIRVLNSGLTPGRIALDSAADLPGNSGYGCQNSNAYVAMVNGGGKIQAWNGSGGAPGLLLAYGPTAKVVDAVQHLCPAGTDPSTAAPGKVCPAPTAYPQVTRKFWDWQYHCTLTTSTPLSAPCPYTSTTPDYITQLTTSYGSLTPATALAAGLQVLPTTADDPAVCDSTTPYTYYAPGSYYINCSTFNVNRTTVFGGGTLVFKGDVNVKGNGPGPHCLVLNQPVGSTPPAIGLDGDYVTCSPTSAAVTPSPQGSMTVFLQGGSLRRQNADFIAPQTFVYMPATCGSAPCIVDLGAGTTGTLLWTAPLDGNFKNLALWSENASGVSPANSPPNQLGAQNKIDLEGILFLPNGLVNFSGNPTYLGAARAQFVAWRLAVGGGSTLELTPDPDKTLVIPVTGVRLIR